ALRRLARGPPRAQRQRRLRQPVRQAGRDHRGALPRMSAAASENADLLARFAPCLRYDSLEGYFADSAEEWTANPGNRLKRAEGTVVATAGDGLSLALLDPSNYANGEAVQPGDYIETSKVDYSHQYTV